jgi:hypothetical protein
MKRSALFLALLCSPALGQQMLLQLSPPPGLPRAGIQLDFANNVGIVAGNVGTAASLITVARSNAGSTDLLPTSLVSYGCNAGPPSCYSTFAANTARLTPGLGLLNEGSRTNYMLNSVLPAVGTTTTAAIPAGTVILWINGAGSATMGSGSGVGCGTGQATQGNPTSFTITTTGTCTVTIAGAVNAAQIEVGNFGSSFIPTTATPVARVGDLVSVNSPPNVSSAYTMLVQLMGFSTLAVAQQQITFDIDDGTNTNRSYLLRNTTTSNFSSFSNTGGVSSQSTGLVLNPGVFAKHAAATTVNSQMSTQDAGNAAASFAAFTPFSPFTAVHIGGNAVANSQACYCYVRGVQEWPTIAFTQAQLQQVTHP